MSLSNVGQLDIPGVMPSVARKIRLLLREGYKIREGAYPSIRREMHLRCGNRSVLDVGLLVLAALITVAASIVAAMIDVTGGWRLVFLADCKVYILGVLLAFWVGLIKTLAEHSWWMARDGLDALQNFVKVLNRKDELILGKLIVSAMKRTGIGFPETEIIPEQIFLLQPYILEELRCRAGRQILLKRAFCESDPRLCGCVIGVHDAFGNLWEIVEMARQHSLLSSGVYYETVMDSAIFSESDLRAYAFYKPDDDSFARWAKEVRQSVETSIID